MGITCQVGSDVVGLRTQVMAVYDHSATTADPATVIALH
jgi:hypothetical protein